MHLYLQKYHRICPLVNLYMVCDLYIYIFGTKKKCSDECFFFFFFVTTKVLVQDKRNGRVFTIVDNRSALMAKKMAGGNQEGQTVLANLLSGGKSN